MDDTTSPEFEESIDNNAGADPHRGQDIALENDGNDYVKGQGGSNDTLAGGNGTDTVIGSASEIDEAFTFDSPWVDAV